MQPTQSNTVRRQNNRNTKIDGAGNCPNTQIKGGCMIYIVIINEERFVFFDVTQALQIAEEFRKTGEQVMTEIID
jgi:hypothetical protein